MQTSLTSESYTEKEVGEMRGKAAQKVVASERRLYNRLTCSDHIINNAACTSFQWEVPNAKHVRLVKLSHITKTLEMCLE